MKKKVVKFIKGHSIASLWFVFYIVVQAICSMGIVVFKVLRDENYANLFLETFEPIYENASGSIYNPEIINGYSNVLSEIVVPILLTSNSIILLFFILKLIIEKDKVIKETKLVDISLTSNSIVLLFFTLKLTIKKDKVIKKTKLVDISKYFLFGFILNITISFIISFFPSNLINDHSAFTESVLSGNFILILLTTGIISPIAEEIIFRYGIQRNLYRINYVYAILYQAVFFGLLHGNLIQIIYATILGIIFGYIYYKTKNFLLSVILHVAINSSSVIVSFARINEFIGLLMLIFLSLLIYLIFNFLDKKKLKIKAL